jgi:DNA-binding transcriptional LysR family regulator
MIPAPADIAYFMEVAQTLNLSRAAERLGIAQPSLSLAMKRLEDAAGVALLVRGKRGVTLTPAGRQMLAGARQLQQAWEGLRGASKAAVTEARGAYTIGMHPSVARYSLAGFLPGLMAANPGLEITLRHDLSRKIAEEIVSMKVDIGIVVNPVAHPDLITRKLCTDRVTFWRAGRKANAAQDIAGGTAILICDPELAQAQSLMKQLRRKNIKFARVVACRDLDVIGDLTAAGAGIGILPGQAASRAPKKLQPVPGAPMFEDEHCLLYRVENKNVQAIRTISAAIGAWFSAR